MRKHLGPDDLGDLLELPLVAVAYEHQPPYRGLEVRGQARLGPEGGTDALDAMAVRYLGPEDGPAYAATAGDSVLVRLVPAELRGWDFADDLA